MNVISLSNTQDRDFVTQVEKESGQSVSQCYQCGNCTAGCPYTSVYDIPYIRSCGCFRPGRRPPCFSCRSIWLCASCQSCTTRCPNNIDVAHVMDVLRHMARREARPRNTESNPSWTASCGGWNTPGRAFEIGLMAMFMAKTGRFWTDMDLAPKTLPKGKLSFIPHKVKNPEAHRQDFRAVQAGGPQMSSRLRYAYYPRLLRPGDFQGIREFNPGGLRGPGHGVGRNSGLELLRVLPGPYRGPPPLLRAGRAQPGPGRAHGGRVRHTDPPAPAA